MRSFQAPEIIAWLSSDFFNGLLKQKAFRLALWGSQRVGYLAIYNAYENFVVHCIKGVLQLKSLQVTDKEFNRRFKDVFGDLFSKCWTDSEVRLARDTRHSLSHAGGRETKALVDQQSKKPRHKFKTVETPEGRIIQIAPEDNKKLIALLQRCATDLTRALVSKNLHHIEDEPEQGSG